MVNLTDTELSQLEAYAQRLLVQPQPDNNWNEPALIEKALVAHEAYTVLAERLLSLIEEVRHWRSVARSMDRQMKGE